jgi:hypothetical protein
MLNAIFVFDISNKIFYNIFKSVLKLPLAGSEIGSTTAGPF